MNRIEQTYLIAAPLEEVWRALTDPEVIATWSGASASYTAEPNMEYSLWDGSIGGRILEVEPNKRLKKTWKPDNWQRDDSVVTFLLTPVAGGTRVDLLHENVEESDFEGTREGWDLYYLGAIKRMYEQAGADSGRMPKKATPRAKPTAKKTAPKKKNVAKKQVAVKAKKATPKKKVAKKKSSKQAK